MEPSGTPVTEHVENLVVGSGFGGSVAAYRLAEAGRPVCVLERGRAYGPGDFAREPWDMGRNFWDPSAGRVGLFDVWSFHGLDAVVSAGLGGGSLIYANVLLRKPEEWFKSNERFGGGYEKWPIDRAALDPHYDAVEQMLQAQPFPAGSHGFTNVRKTLAMRDAADRMTTPHEFTLPNLAVSFRPTPTAKPSVGVPLADPGYPNYHERHGDYGDHHRTTCVLCGQCDLGCNFGSKNTLDHNYLSAAEHHGAEIRVMCEVKTIVPTGNRGYDVTYIERLMEGSAETPTVRRVEHRIHCSRLILAAGTFGTTFLLMTNQKKLRGMVKAPILGSRFSGNGDFMTIMRRTREADGSPRRLYASQGPVITSALRILEEGEGGLKKRGYYIQDCGYPMLLNWAVEANSGSAFRVAKFALQRFWSNVTRNPRSGLGNGLSTLFGDGADASSSMPLLGIGRDVPDGRLSLKRGRYLACDWTTRTSKSYFDDLHQSMDEIATALNADHLADVLTWKYFKRTITVHPLGGCPMGANDKEGVCDQFGEVFGCDNLFVADGAVMPGAVGANPSLTIAAFSDRMSTAILGNQTRKRVVETARPS